MTSFCSFTSLVMTQRLPLSNFSLFSFFDYLVVFFFYRFFCVYLATTLCDGASRKIQPENTKGQGSRTKRTEQCEKSLNLGISFNLGF